MRPIDADALRQRLLVLRCNVTNIQCITDIFDICLTEVNNAPTIETEKVKESELIKAYTKGFDTGVETERQQSIQHSCEACKYRFYAFDGHPCVNCRRNLFLVDEIREQKNDLWKDGTPNG